MFVSLTSLRQGLDKEQEINCGAIENSNDKMANNEAQNCKLQQDLKARFMRNNLLFYNWRRSSQQNGAVMKMMRSRLKEPTELAENRIREDLGL